MVPSFSVFLRVTALSVVQQQLPTAEAVPTRHQLPCYCFAYVISFSPHSTARKLVIHSLPEKKSCVSETARDLQKVPSWLAQEPGSELEICGAPGHSCRLLPCAHLFGSLLFSDAAFGLWLQPLVPRDTLFLWATLQPEWQRTIIFFLFRADLVCVCSGARGCMVTHEAPRTVLPIGQPRSRPSPFRPGLSHPPGPLKQRSSTGSSSTGALSRCRVLSCHCANCSFRKQ